MSIPLVPRAAGIVTLVLSPLLVGDAATSGLAVVQSEMLPVRVYTYSRSTAGGFADERLDALRREIGQQAKAEVELGYSKEDADLSVHFLGQGELTLRISARADAEGYLFTPNEESPRMWVLLESGGHSVELAEEGSGMRAMTRLARSIADWVRSNTTALRQHRLSRPGKSPTGDEGRSP